ncbi:MAG: UDP-N-acetylmuramate--L-alanine ligase [Sulfuricella sp.]|nr:UDP-N-acetylmuramate--L-alanine ligase [Sulfuricella sp.]
MKHKVKHVHFVGIGGVGMSGIAEVLLNLGYEVSGSDLGDNAVTRRLKSLGAQVYHGHATANLEQADVVVVSTAVKEDNPEVAAARQRNIPVVPRAMMLAELMRFKQGIAVAGTHGKTTTTSLIASILGEAGMDPTFVIGGKLEAAGANARLGQGEFIVAEADESDASFLYLMPVMAVVTNIDADHMETYGHDFGRLKQAFVDFIQRLPFYGMAVLCSDDANVREIMPRITKSNTTYGLEEGAQVRGVNVRHSNGRMDFKVQRDGMPELDVTLNLPGQHNVLNALAAIAVAMEVGAPDAAIVKGLAEFSGVGRRFERYGEVALPDYPLSNSFPQAGERAIVSSPEDGLPSPQPSPAGGRGGDGEGRLSRSGGFTLVDDYGHHPVEMAATLAAARGAFPGRRLVLAFQPHRYTRTRDLFEDFVRVLSTVDALLLTEIYPAGEAPIVAADGRALARAIRVAGKVEPIFVETLAELPQSILGAVRDGDVVLTMGAGSIGQIPGQLVRGGA